MEPVFFGVKIWAIQKPVSEPVFFGQPVSEPVFFGQPVFQPVFLGGAKKSKNFKARIGARIFSEPVFQPVFGVPKNPKISKPVFGPVFSKNRCTGSVWLP